MLSACSKNNTSVPNNQNTGRVDLEKSAYLLKEDNWVYELMIHYPNKTEQVVDAYTLAFVSNAFSAFCCLNTYKKSGFVGAFFGDLFCIDVFNKLLVPYQFDIPEF